MTKQRQASQAKGPQPRKQTLGEGGLQEQLVGLKRKAAARRVKVGSGGVSWTTQGSEEVPNSEVDVMASSAVEDDEQCRDTASIHGESLQADKAID